MTLKILSEQEVGKQLGEPLPHEQLAPLARVLHELFSANLRNGEFFQLAGKLGPSASYLKVELLQSDDSGTVFEFFMASGEENAAELPLPKTLVDFAGYALGEFFNSEREAHLPIDYTPFDWLGTDVHGRENFHQFQLEREADAWLAGSRGPDEDDA